jgi:hypothetical protein
MTMGYGCAREGCTNPVNWIITRISPAGTISVCDDDMPMFLIPLLGSELGVDPGRFYESVKRFTDREAAREARAAKEAPPPAEADERQEEPPQEDYDLGPEIDDRGVTAVTFFPGKTFGEDPA